jgi:ATP-binding cassette subfamily B protein
VVTDKKHTDLGLYRRLLRQARPYWPHIVLVFLLDLLAIPLSLLTPIPLAIAVDSALGSEPLPGFLAAWLPTDTWSWETVLVLVVILLVGIALLSQLQDLATSLLGTYTGEKLDLDFRSRLFRHVQRLSLAYHDAHGTSDSIYRIQYDTSALQYIAIYGVLPFVTASVTFASMLYVIARIDWQLVLIALAISPILFLLTRISRRGLRQRSHEAKKVQSAAFSVVQEVLGALRVVKAFGQEDREQQRFVGRSNEGIRVRMRYTLAANALGLLLGMTTAIGTAAVLYIGVRHVQLGILSLGGLLMVMGYLSQLYSPLQTISRKIASLQTHLASAERAFALLDEAPDVPDRPDARAIARANGALDFRGVWFSYDGAQPVLRDIDFRIPAGMRVGIAGSTGSGKTTLMSLLTRFYDPTEGQILLDGVDLRDYKLADLRDQFAIVLQEPLLFSTTIGENIAYARPDASKEQIVKAARAANAHDFVVGLPEGYDTQVGERGMLLSGGERQRIALARAFLKDAPILIMDEPTSSVDMRTEAGIMEAMERLMRGRTTFMIAHRLTTLENCDLLLVIEDGRLVDTTSDVSATVQDALALGGLGASIHGETVDA